MGLLNIGVSITIVIRKHPNVPESSLAPLAPLALKGKTISLIVPCHINHSGSQIIYSHPNTPSLEQFPSSRAWSHTIYNNGWIQINYRVALLFRSALLIRFVLL